MGGIFLAICGARVAATLMIAIGVLLLIIATVEYYRAVRTQLAQRTAST
jgi:hypothetical protein